MSPTQQAKIHSRSVFCFCRRLIFLYVVKFVKFGSNLNICFQPENIRFEPNRTHLSQSAYVFSELIWKQNRKYTFTTFNITSKDCIKSEIVLFYMTENWIFVRWHKETPTLTYSMKKMVKFNSEGNFCFTKPFKSIVFINELNYSSLSNGLA